MTPLESNEKASNGASGNCGFGYCIATELTENTEKNQVVKNKGQNWVAVLGIV